MLAELGLAGLADRPVTKLSLGQRQRVAVARALQRVRDGAWLLLLDEPTAHLDEANARLVLDAVQRAVDNGAAAIIAAHERTAAVDMSSSDADRSRSVHRGHFERAAAVARAPRRPALRRRRAGRGGVAGGGGADGDVGLAHRQGVAAAADPDADGRGGRRPRVRARPRRAQVRRTAGHARRGVPHRRPPPGAAVEFTGPARARAEPARGGGAAAAGRRRRHGARPPAAGGVAAAGGRAGRGRRDRRADVGPARGGVGTRGGGGARAVRAVGRIARRTPGDVGAGGRPSRSGVASPGAVRGGGGAAGVRHGLATTAARSRRRTRAW